jgi:DNA-directed RNA polymerase subunit RPC12/RpoP
MRLVPDLNEITECPNCGSIRLYTVEDRFAFSKYFKCGDCGEEIREGNITTDSPAISIPYDESRTIKTPEVTTRGKIVADTLRQEIGYLRSNIHDAHSMMLVNKLTDIFNLIADYIEEH